MTVTILDTAEGEENQDRQRINDLRDKIHQTKGELRDSDAGRVGDIDIEYKLITEDIQLNGSIDLIGEDAVDRITAGNGMDREDWWLKEGYINENLDFAKGVVRKRGLGKSIYYKAYAEDDSISTYVDLPEKGKVSILAGLGGGTGSGVLIDLAQHLQQKQRTAEITLFGVLPNHTEGTKESTNAYAALSELEYLSLTDENVFKDIVLLPIDPTGFDGKTGDTIQSSRLLDELDEALIYLLLSYYNTQNLEDPFADSPSYAPFTIGVPQVLRYNVEAINEGRSALRDIINEKREAINAEREIYSEVERLLASQYGADLDGNLRDLDEADLEQRLEEVEALVELDLFSELNYESVEVFHEIIQDAKREADDIESQIDIINGSLRAVNTSSGENRNFVDDIDQGLAEILEDDLQLIARRKSFLKQKQVASDAQIRDAIKYLLDAEDGAVNPGVKLNQLEAKLDEFRERRGRLEDRLDDAQAELQEAREEQSNEVNREASRLRQSIAEDVQTFQEFDETEIKAAVSDLENALNKYRTNVVNAESETETQSITKGPVTSALDDVEQLLEPLHVEFNSDRQDINASLSALRQARQAFLKMNEDEGTLEKITPWTSSSEEEREEAYKTFRMQKTKLDDKDVYSLGPAGSNFSAELEYDPQSLLHEVGREHNAIKSGIVDELKSQVGESHTGYVDDFRSELERGGSLPQLMDIARDAIREDLVDTGDIQNRIDEAEEELADSNTSIERYESVLDVFQDMTARRDAFVEHLSSFRSKREGYAEEDDRSVVTEREESAYVSNIQPSDVFRATGDDDIADSQLLKGEDERRRIRNELQDLTENAREQRYTGLRRRKIAKDRSRYDEMKIRAAVSSRAIDQIPPDALDFEDVFSGAFDLGGSGKRVESPYTSWQNEFGDRWDIGLGVFIDGVFLDNLRKVVNADGYRDGYQRRLDELGDDIIAHHSYGLSEGWYTRREGLLNLEDPDEVGFYLRDEAEVVGDLLNDYQTVSQVDRKAAEENPESQT